MRGAATSPRRTTVTFDVWGGAALLVVASVVIGQALQAIGLHARAAGPVVGFAIVIIVASIAIELPGRATTAAVVLLVLAVAALALVGVRGPRPRPSAAPWVAAAIAAVGAAIPFIANGRTGLLGVSLDNDTANHLLYADALRSAAVARLWPAPTGYPLGPHSVVDALATGLGMRLDLAFDALAIATVVITALVGVAALRSESWWRRVATGVLAALLYLGAAYYAEDSFKEPMLGVLLLAYVLHLEYVRAQWRPDGRLRWPVLLPASLLVAAGVYVYGYLAVAWFGITLLVWLALEVAVTRQALRGWPDRLDGLWTAGTAAILALVVLLAPIAGRIVNLVSSFGVSPASNGALGASVLGNLVSPLSPYEAFGIWNSPDFRLAPVGAFHAGELAALALAILVFGLLWSLVRRQFVLPAAVAACAIIYVYSRHGQSPYVTAKALVIPAPVIAVTQMRGLLSRGGPSLPRAADWTRVVVAAAFAVFALHSSYSALRDEPVWPSESTAELLTFARQTQGSSVLFLGDSDYATWIFDRSKLSTPSPSAPWLGRQMPRPSKPTTPGTGFDWDSVITTSLNRFRWVVTTNSPYASQAPAAFRLVRRLRMYELWERVGTASARQAPDPPGAPGAVLDCSTRAGRRLSREPAVAASLATPDVVPLSGLVPGGSERVTLRLPVGYWDLSIEYVSSVGLRLSAGGRQWRVPAYLDRLGPWFDVGRVGSAGGPVEVTVAADRPSSLTGPRLTAQLEALAATREPDVRTILPLARSCGRYVDWYRTAAR